MRTRYGLAIGDSARANLATALAMAAAGRGIDPDECIQRARHGDEQLLQMFVHAVTIHETYFFRHPEQFDLLRQIAKERLRARPGAPVRALSAGCASGEEAYSMAIALQSAAEGTSPTPRIEVLGIDIDDESLQKARGACYERWSLRQALPPWSQGSISRSGEDGGEVSPHYRATVRFRSVNLHDSFLALLLANDAPFDFIFCRNVLMYLVPTAADRVARHLLNLLAPGGYLTFSPVDLDRVPKATSHPEDPTFLSRPVAMRNGVGRARAAGGISNGRHLGEMLAEAKRLIDGGELTRAKAVCADLLKGHPDSPAALFLAAMVEMESGSGAPAEKLLLDALQHQPDFALAHFALSTLLKKQGRANEARARLVRLSQLLAALPAEAVLAGPEEITCGWLRSVVNDHLNA